MAHDLLAGSVPHAVMPGDAVRAMSEGEAA